MRYLSTALFAAICVCSAGVVSGVDVSPAPFLQWFDASYATMRHRSPDLFHAGYGAVWTPPPGRADQGDFSVGYDVYDRFDLGQWHKPTLYGTENGLKIWANTLHTLGADLHVDFIMNHNGFSDAGTPGFIEAGGYPGFVLQDPDGGADPYGVPNTDGDFHSIYWGGAEYERLAGLIDIAHERNWQFIRTPVDPNDSRNIPSGVTPAFGRLANVADPGNARFYPDIGHNTIFVFDPATGEGDIAIHAFNLDNPLAGDAVPENATGYLMRNAQWLVQVVGVDGLRIDAGKHMQGFVFDFLDRGVYRSNPRTLLDGSQKHVFSYSEVFDADPAVLLPHVKKSIDPGNPGVIGGNRDTLDFKWYFAVKDNLEQYGQNNAWFNVKDAGLDVSHNGLHDGSAGVKFVHNHDVFQPFKLNNVAHALMLMLPGNATVYFNGKEFGDNRDFPKNGRGDALSVAGGGSPITRLVDVRATHGRGNYLERWVDNQGIYIFERESTSLVGLSNRGDGGFDTRTVQVALAPGTHLVELTGNAADATVDPLNDISEVITVFQESDGNSYVNLRVPRNFSATGTEHQRGYVVYGLGTPHADAGLELSGASGMLAGDTNITNNYENGVKRQSDVHVVSADSFQVRLQTREVRHLGLDALRDIHADGDNALLKLDGGRDLNGNGFVDFVTPGSESYGFEQFGDKSSPLIGFGGLGAPRGDGEFLQTIDTTNLDEGFHYLEARAFRHRTDGGPAVFSTWKETFYVDRLPPQSSLHEFRPFGGPGDNDVVIASDDLTGDNVHVFLNLAANVSDQAIYDLVTAGQGSTEQVDVNLFKTGLFGIPNGHNVLTIVTFEPTGTSSVIRQTGLTPESARGAGLGDLNHDGSYQMSDIANAAGAFEEVLYSQDALFNPAADVNGDGLVNTYDLLGLGGELTTAGADSSIVGLWQEVKQRRVDFNNDGIVDQTDVGILESNVGVYDWTYDLDVSGGVDSGDRDFMLANFSVVPEPSTCALALAALAVLSAAACGRRRRRQTDHQAGMGKSSASAGPEIESP